MTDTREQFDRLASLYLPIGLAVFVLVVGVFAVFLWRYRFNASPDPRRQSVKAEVAWIAVLAVIVAVLVAATFHVQSRVDALAGSTRPAVQIGVVAAKWDWTFDYANGATTRDVVVVPAGRPVGFSAVSIDVLHDFWVPDLRFQRQVWPDHRERFTLVFPHAGRYQGLCAWFCGLNHKDMRFEVRALAPPAFERWLARTAQ
jgi:cytochrome c oxidase subunit 2